MPVILTKKARPITGLSYSEERNLREKEQWLQQIYEKKEIQQGVKHDPKDLARVKAKLDQVRAQLSNSPDRAAGKDRVQIEMQIKKIEDAINQKWGGKIPPWAEYQMMPRQGGIYYNRLKNKIMRLNADKEYAELVRRWRYLRRCLEPQDPDIANMMNLFPQ